MSADPTTRKILDEAARYVVLKSDQGITVGLHLNETHYGEGHSPSGNLDEAVHEAHARATSAKKRDRKRTT